VCCVTAIILELPIYHPSPFNSSSSSNMSKNGRSGIVTEQGAAELVKLLLERGYFHDGDPDAAQDQVLDLDASLDAEFSASSALLKNKMGLKGIPMLSLDDSYGDFMASSSSMNYNYNDSGNGTGGDGPAAYSWDDAIFVVAVDGSYSTMGSLQNKYCEHLSKTGRWNSLKEAADALGIHDKDCKRIVAAVLKKDSTLLHAGDEVLTKAYLDETTAKVFHALDQSEGRLAIEDLAKDIYHLPTTVSFNILADRLKETTHVMRLGNGCKVVVTNDYLDAYRQKVLDHFVTLTEPVKVKAVATERCWEATWVAKIMRGLVPELPGKLSGDSYVPTIYTSKRNKAVNDFFSANGFLTAEECPAMGILPSEMKGVLLDTFPTALVLKTCIIHPDIIVTPVQAAVQEAIEERGWLDLSVYIPGQILSQEEDADMLVREHILDPQDGDEEGIAMLSPQVALFFSQAFIGDVEETILPSLIESFAKTRAEELEGASDTIEAPNRKSKKKSALKSAPATGEAVIDVDVVPIEDVIEAIVDANPELAAIANTSDILADSVLTELFRQAFISYEFQSACESAVEAESQRLESEKASTASRGRKDGASRVQSTKAAFEDPGCFATACYLIQTLAKFVQYAADSGLSETDVDALKQDMLNGPCADFTSRITQFCLFKHEVEDNMFSFQAYKIEEDGSGLPYFCSLVDYATRQFHPTFVSCDPDEESKPRDPLPTLREVLPTSVGVSLARQWVLCGGDCYAGGIKLADDGKSIFTRPGDFDAFLAHVEENCLVMCGLPFKKLDKKSEKSFLFDRRRRLVQLLQETTVPQKVLELTIMILFQLSKNLVVTGSLLRGPILQLLSQERKISEDVADSLRELAESIERRDDVDEALVERVKDCGLGRA
jgi:hypothetical protein